jgi:hypothetical protein
VSRWLFGWLGCAMSELAEVRRFWPGATALDFCGPLYIARPAKRHKLTLAKSSDGTWYLCDWRGSSGFACEFGPTIAAAMAAAGFAKRPKGGHAKLRAMLALSARLHPMLPGKTRIPLAYRQRPRKGVRLGSKAWRLACWMAIYKSPSLVTPAEVRASREP